MKPVCFSAGSVVWERVRAVDHPGVGWWLGGPVWLW
jgi:hypothetical protein